jgi:RNA polymerase sigma factor for flagellar operon FliA
MVALHEHLPASSHLALVDRVVAQITRRLPPYVSREDLRGVGLLAAVRSGLHDLTPENAVQMSGKVRTAILDELRREDPLPRRLRQRVRSTQALARALEQSLGRQATVPEIATASDLTENEVDRLLRLGEAPTEPLSLELPDSGPTPAETAEASDRMESVTQALMLIPAREAMVLRALFFSDAGADQVSRRMGISVQRVRQIRDLGLRHMGEILRSP